MTRIVICHDLVNWMHHLWHSKLEQHFTDIAHLARKLASALCINWIVAEEVAVLTKHCAAAGDRCRNEIGSLLITNGKERIDRSPGQLYGTMAFAIVMMNGAA